MEEILRLRANFAGRTTTTAGNVVMAGVFVALALLSTISIVAWRSISAYEDGTRRLAQSYAVIAELGQVETAHARMRVAWRTYLTGGAADALDDYRASRDALGQQIRYLGELTSDNAAQHARIVDLGDAIRHDARSTTDAVGRKVDGLLEEPGDILRTIVARSAERDRIADIVDTARETERGLLAQRQRDNSLQGARTKAWIAAGSVASLAMLAFAFVALRRESARRSRVQERLERYAMEVAELYDHAPCGYHSIGGDGVVTRINDTALRMLGYERREVVGRLRAADLMAPESARAFEARFSELVRGDALVGAEYTYRRRDGTEFIARVDGARAGVDGAAGDLRATIVDITEQKASETEMRNLNGQLAAYSQRVEAINRELEGFSYSVSHDLRAPLRAIDGFAMMLEEDHGDQLDAEARRLLAVVRENAAAMGRLIDDLLAFSRVGKVSFVPGDVDMLALVGEVLTERANDAAVTLGPLPPARGDRALLKQVWANLIDNAVKYSAKVAERDIRIAGFVHEGGDTEYRIEDNGAGFDMRYYDKLFGVFQRLHSPSEFPGTGVGLAIVQRIIGRHGGRVWAESRPGAGATFHFRLPSGGANA
jgi:PAS domain S-box-containing protein